MIDDLMSLTSLLTNVCFAYIVNGIDQ